MRPFRSTLLACAMATFGVALAGCSTVDRAEEPRVANQSQTGSNIPKKDKADRVQTLGSDSLNTPLPPPTRPPAGAGAP